MNALQTVLKFDQTYGGMVRKTCHDKEKSELQFMLELCFNFKPNHMNDHYQSAFSNCRKYHFRYDGSKFGKILNLKST